MSTVIAFEVPSKSSVHKAGRVLRDSNAGLEELSNAMDVLSVWRSFHSYPINTFQAYLRSKIKKDAYQKAIIAQRLKRMPSIVSKLKRLKGMGLETMQDIGGIRVILKNIDDVYSLHNALLKARFAHKALLPPDDYIKNPKRDGYRSLHQVFKYASTRHPELNVLHVELQIRTQLQHSWATAVETLGIIEQSSFKTGEGDEAFKRFFKLASALFSLDEGTPVLAEYANTSREEIISEIRKLEEELQITTKLKSIVLSAQRIEKTKNKFNEYYLLELDTKKGTISTVAVPRDQLTFAESLYKAREKDTLSNSAISIVLISVGSVAEIRKAYPNYFLDTNDFISNLHRMMNE